MDIRNCDGIAVHARKVSPKEATLVGVRLPRTITPQEHEQLLRMNSKIDSGHIGVRIGINGAAVTYAGRLSNPKLAKKRANWLSSVVARVTGIRSVLCPLPTYQDVSRALAA